MVPPCDMIASDEYGCRDSRESEGERKQEFDVCLLTSEVKRPGAVDTPVLYTWVPRDMQLQLWVSASGPHRLLVHIGHKRYNSEANDNNSVGDNMTSPRFIQNFSARRIFTFYRQYYHCWIDHPKKNAYFY